MGSTLPHYRLAAPPWTWEESQRTSPTQRPRFRGPQLPWTTHCGQRIAYRGTALLAAAPPRTLGDQGDLGPWPRAGGFCFWLGPGPGPWFGLRLGLWPMVPWSHGPWPMVPWSPQGGARQICHLLKREHARSATYLRGSTPDLPLTLGWSVPWSPLVPLVPGSWESASQVGVCLVVGGLPSSWGLPGSWDSGRLPNSWGSAQWWGVCQAVVGLPNSWGSAQ